MVHEEPMRPAEQPFAEALNQVSLQVEFKDRVYINTGTIIPTTPVHQPHVLAIGIQVYPRYYTQGPALRQFCPTVIGAIRIIVLSN